MGEVLSKALLNTLMGMGTVFVVLIVISLIISLFKYIPALERKFRSAFRKKAKKAPKNVPAENKPAPKRPVLVQEEEETEMGDELIAVIMAAIVASSGGAVSADRLRIRSVRRVNRR